MVWNIIDEFYKSAEKSQRALRIAADVMREKRINKKQLLIGLRLCNKILHTVSSESASHGDITKEVENIEKEFDNWYDKCKRALIAPETVLAQSDKIDSVSKKLCVEPEELPDELNYYELKILKKREEIHKADEELKTALKRRDLALANYSLTQEDLSTWKGFKQSMNEHYSNPKEGESDLLEFIKYSKKNLSRQEILASSAQVKQFKPLKETVENLRKQAQQYRNMIIAYKKHIELGEAIKWRRKGYVVDRTNPYSCISLDEAVIVDE